MHGIVVCSTWIGRSSNFPSGLETFPVAVEISSPEGPEAVRPSFFAKVVDIRLTADPLSSISSAGVFLTWTLIVIGETPVLLFGMAVLLTATIGSPCTVSLSSSWSCDLGMR